MKNNSLSANNIKRIIIISLIFLFCLAFVLNRLSLRNNVEYQIEKKVSSIVDQRKYYVNLSSYEDVSFLHIKYNYFAYGKRNDLDDLNTALNVVSMLKTEYPDRVFTLQVGACGSSQPNVYVYESDILDLNFNYPDSSSLLSEMNEHNIHGLIVSNYYYNAFFDDLSDKTLKKLCIVTEYDARFETLKNLHGLENLHIVLNEDDRIECVSDISVVSQMDSLRSLTISGDLSKIEFPATPCDKITNVDINYTSDLDKQEQIEKLQEIFPNAKIVIEQIEI